MRHIVFVAFEQALLLDIAGPLQVFASARDLCAAAGLPDPYRLSLVSPKGGRSRPRRASPSRPGGLVRSDPSRSTR